MQYIYLYEYILYKQNFTISIFTYIRGEHSLATKKNFFFFLLCLLY